MGLQSGKTSVEYLCQGEEGGEKGAELVPPSCAG